MYATKRKAMDDYKKAHCLDGYTFFCSTISNNLYVVPPNIIVKFGCPELYFEIKSLDTLMRRVKITTRIEILNSEGKAEFRFDNLDGIIQHILITKLAGL